MPIKGIINLPGDKSISHRALLFASLSNKKCIINNISTGQDVETTRKCLEQLGIVSTVKDSTIEIKGGTFKESKFPLNCENSGTTIRLLVGLLAGQGLAAKFTGDSSLSKRPMDRIIKPLHNMGLSIKSNDGYLPLVISSNELKGIDYILPISSAQIKSCIILAALGSKGETKIVEKNQSRDHTEIMLKELGGTIKYDDMIYVHPLNNFLNPFNITIPGDPSSAAFFAAAAALIPNSDITIKNLLANPTRIGFFEIIKSMGAGVEWLNMHQELGEWVGDVHVYFKPLSGFHIKENLVPSIIDEIPIIAILATQADSPTIIEGASELRVKESDRIHAICKNLTFMGAEVIEKKDGFIINPGNMLHNAKIETFSDHRIAMAFSIAGLLTGKKNILDNKECVDISFPGFFTMLNGIIQ
tara:strand:- start:2440 stop:3684 length:1245 start_codon:yes stop_codon:yes gene_type:complete